MQTKKLWDYKELYKSPGFFEIEMFHHTPVYNSWKDFINDRYALSCNCISDNPLLYWYWDNDEDSDSEDDDNQDDNENWKQNPKEYFRRIILIYKKWQVEMGKIIINVTSEDEFEIRKFLIEQQKQYFIN